MTRNPGAGSRAACSTWPPRPGAAGPNSPNRLGTEAELERADLERSGRWKPPHQLIAEEIERVTRRAEAAHLRFVKTVRMLAELRRSTQLLYVGHAGQINLGHQQMNMTSHEPQGGGEGQGR